MIRRKTDENYDPYLDTIYIVYGTGVKDRISINHCKKENYFNQKSKKCLNRTFDSSKEAHRMYWILFWGPKNDTFETTDYEIGEDHKLNEIASCQSAQPSVSIEMKQTKGARGLLVYEKVEEDY